MTQPSFRVEDELLTQVAAASTRVSLFCSGVTEALGSEPPADTADSFGEYGVFPAYLEFFRRWKAEAGTTATAAGDFSAALVEALRGYDRADTTAAQRFSGR